MGGLFSGSAYNIDTLCSTTLDTTISVSASFTTCSYECDRRRLLNRSITKQSSQGLLVDVI